MKCLSFFKVGGGFRAWDYETIKSRTEGKWTDWDRKRPPTEYIELGGKDGLAERPDVWIKPCDSVVVAVKASSVASSDQFKFPYTLRFPRFKALKEDKTWEDALSVDDFIQLKISAEAESKDKKFQVDMKRRKITKKLKKEAAIAGNNGKVKTPYAGPKTQVFEGLNFHVTTEMVHPYKKSKAEIEQIIKSNGGNFFQSPTAKEDIICVGDKRLVKVASLMKSGQTNIVKASWVLDAVKQAEVDGPGRQRFLVPFEPAHMFHMTDQAREEIEGNVDDYGDSYARDATVDGLKLLLDSMATPKDSTFSANAFLTQLEERGKGLGETASAMFRSCVAYFPPADTNSLLSKDQLGMELRIARYHFLFAGGSVSDDDEDDRITHFVLADEVPEVVKALRHKISQSRRSRLPRVLGLNWIQDSWKEGTLLDEEKYVIHV